jgi:3-oxoacyl-[acyl-carrier-protein] synthase II
VTAIAITGLGAVAANGHDADAIWSACLGGVSGVAPLVHAPRSIPSGAIGAEIRGFDATRFVDRRDLQTFDTTQVLAAACARMALDDCGRPAHPPERVGAVIGSALGPTATITAGERALADEGVLAVSHYHAAASTISFTASLPAMRLGLRGPVFAASGACATAAYNVVCALQLLEAGDADLMLAGAVDAARVGAILASFANMRQALATGPDPAAACRPLDRDRGGLVFGEGAAVFALERLADAKRRGARVRAVLRGYGLSSDAGSVLAADRAGVARALATALQRAAVAPADVDHVNLHAAGTRQGDLAEAEALHEVLGPVASRVPVTAAKSMLGHAMGAAAGLELVVAVRTLETGLIPPTRNLEHPDPAIDLSASPQPRRADVRIAVKTASGLGGLNAALVLERHG